MAVTSVRLQPDIETDLEAIAEELQRSKSWVINQALREFMTRQDQEQRRWQETLQAIDSVARGKVASGQAVHDWLATWGTETEADAPKSGL